MSWLTPEQHAEGDRIARKLFHTQQEWRYRMLRTEEQQAWSAMWVNDPGGYMIHRRAYGPFVFFEWVTTCGCLFHEAKTIGKDAIYSTLFRSWWSDG